MTSSIRRNLLLALLAILAVALLAGAAATYHASVQQAEVLLDYQLRQTALALRDQAFGAVTPPALPGSEDDFDYSIQVWNEDGVSIYYSYPPHVFPNRAQLGFSTIDTPEGPWRVFAMQGRREVVQVAQPVSRRDQLAAHAALQAMRPFLLLLPIMGLSIWVVVGRGLAPIARLARTIGSRTPAALQPVTDPVPAEVQPLVQALNELLARLNAALQAQRQFVADAAHELRTPLAALLLQAQLVERASDDAQRVAALAELKQGLERATRVIQQLLTLAREEPGAAPGRFESVSLDELLTSLTLRFQTLAAARGVSLRYARTEDIADRPIVQGEPQALQTLLSNIIDNALRYTPAGGEVVVAIRGAPRVVTIDDSGPGIPLEERERVFDRFYRRPQTSVATDGAVSDIDTMAIDVQGSGLGLAIVRAIADRHGIAVSLGESAAGGLAVQLRFPRDAPPP
ncbi:MAG TPA: ATP-binding protein [Steroidobacteraceae bacterium]|jgi:two-component system OmpR family sensor kinase|nr:ATP-binding protein [Steroidobacteraceae bacterium]